MRVRVRVKVCGIRSEADLAVAVEAGADAVGFLCGTTHVTEDALDPQRAAELSAATPPYVTRVLVTHLESADAVLGLADRVGCDAIQVHGLVTRDTARDVFRGAAGRRVTRALHVTGPEAVEAARELVDCAHALHLDTRTADRLGGTGRTHDWAVSRRIVAEARERGQPVVLAGGLTPGNVRAAIAAVGPYAVDVNSGVEDGRGDKAPAAVAAFVAAAHAAR